MRTSKFLKSIRAYFLLVIASAITILVVSSCSSRSVAQPSTNKQGVGAAIDLFSEFKSQVEQVSAIPVFIPDEIVLRTSAPLYPEIFDLTPQSYELAYGSVPNCSNAGFCREGWIQGYQVGVDGYKAETIEELIEERKGHLETATKRSDDSIEELTLVDGTEAVVLPWIGYTHPGPTEVIFEKEGYRYVFSVVMANNDYVVSLANSALD